MSAAVAGAQDRTAWVVGGGSGIGRAVALRLAADGFRVAVSGRRAEALEAAARLAGDGALAVPADATDDASVAAAHAGVVEALGPVGLLVCCAGTNVARRAWSEVAAADLARVVDTNLTAVARCVLPVLPGMRAAGGGQVVVVSSWAAWRHLPVAGAAYSASKTALGALVESLNAEEGRHGVRATHLCPAEVDTDILLTRPQPPSEEERARMLRPEDVAGVVSSVAGLPPHVCVNELVVSPVHNRFYLGTA